MKCVTIEEQADEVLRLFKESCRPFPYAGCRALIRDSGEAYEGLIPDLDLYFSEIAGYCSWGRTIPKWSKEKLFEARNKLSKSFFDKHPKFQPLQPAVSETGTPDMYESLKLYEVMRRNLVDLISQVLSERSRIEAFYDESNASKIPSVSDTAEKVRKKIIA